MIYLASKVVLHVGQKKHGKNKPQCAGSSLKGFDASLGSVLTLELLFLVLGLHVGKDHGKLVSRADCIICLYSKVRVHHVSDKGLKIVVGCWLLVAVRTMTSCVDMPMLPGPNCSSTVGNSET